MRAVRRLVIIVAVRAEHDDVEPVRSPNGNRVVYNRTTDYFPITGPRSAVPGFMEYRRVIVVTLQRARHGKQIHADVENRYSGEPCAFHGEVIICIDAMPIVL